MKNFRDNGGRYTKPPYWTIKLRKFFHFYLVAVLTFIFGIGAYATLLSQTGYQNPIEVVKAQESHTVASQGIVGYSIFDEIKANVTAYSEFDSCHYQNCEMASGKRAYIGAIACPRYYKLNTRVIIDNIAYICEDRVSKDYPYRFDIFMGYGEESYEKAKKFGKQYKTITIYKS